jgi:AcrR family transcriptional regulator
MSKIDKREQILKAAVALFGKAHDARKVSVEEIAAEAGVSPTTIYNYFGTRDGLVVDTSRSLIREIMKMAGAVMRSDLPFPQKLKAMLSGKVDLIGRYSGEVLAKLLSQDMTASRAGRELFESEVRALWLEFVKSGKKEGYIDPSANDEDLLAYFEILRAGLAARPDLVERYRADMPQMEKLTELICFGFLNKDIELFPDTEKP